MKKSFASFSFGCRVNEAEKVTLDRKLLQMGFSYSLDHPDIYIINSCAVTGKAEREVRQHIYQIRKKFPTVFIIVSGCAATNWLKNNILVKDIDLIISNNEKLKIPEILANRFGQSTASAASTQTKDKFLFSGKLMVKIQDGCDRFCSYCIVPFLRGQPKSRSIAEIVKEIRSQKNMKEVILTAINTDAFGKDTGETLIQLIDALLTKTTVPLVSFGSIHPSSITDQFLSYYQSILPTKRFKPFFHIPIQSGSNAILKLMNRKYTKEEMAKKILKLKRINPETFIGTDIIVGFPGETDKEFQETYDFLKKMPIDKIHVFRFSPRPGTAADNMRKVYGESTPEEKRKRSKQLPELTTTFSSSRR